MDSIVTVTSASDTHDLTVVATVKLELGISGSSEDDELQRLLTEASVQIATYCNRVFAEQTYSEVYRNVHRCSPLPLTHAPVASITSVTVDGTVLESTEYELYADAGFLYRLSGDTRIAWTACKITVVYVAGYTLLTELPYDIERACIDLVKRRYHGKERDPGLRTLDVPDVAREEYWGGPSLAIVGGLPADIARTLDPYRLYSFG